MRTKFILSLMALALSSLAADPEMSNNKSGISATFSGTRGTDFQEEYFFHDKMISDRKVVYIRSGTDITLSHNALNSVVGSDGYEITGDDQGVIRFKVDRDLQWAGRWANGGSANYPAYSAPFSLSDLEYESGVSVVGTVGPKPGITLTNANKATYYWRGVEDEFGDEWHSLHVGDDDSHVTSDSEWQASDGKTFLLVVDPMTPCLTLTTNGTTGQFYTSPAKTYFLPKIHEQTTWLSGDTVEIRLDCLYGSNVVHRINGGSWETNAEPHTFTSADLSDGTNTFEYWSRTDAAVKTRTIVKNPDFPSSGESHGSLMWGNETGWQQMSNHLHLDEFWLDKWKTDFSNYGGQNAIDSNWRSGRRTRNNAGARNAIVAKIVGWETLPPTKSISYAEYSKRSLMDNIRTSDAVGHEQNHSGTSLPCRDHVYRGYYDVNTILDMVFAYDILIANYRSDQFADGITEIEDFFIRDQLAGWVLDEMMRDGGWEDPIWYGLDTGGMWDTARKVGCLAITLCLRDYSSSYYGSSGWGTATNLYLWAPYPDQSFTWKQLYVDNDQTPVGFPNLVKRFGIDEYMISAEGHFTDRIGYFDYQLMGHTFGIAANLLYIHTGERFERLELAMMRSAEGTLMGLKDSSGPGRFNMVLPWNNRFYEPAAIAIPHFQSLSSSHQQSFPKKATPAQEFYYAWYTPELEEPEDVVETPVINPGGGTFESTQSVTITTATSGATIYYTTDGTTPTTGSTQYSGAFDVPDTATVKAFATKTDFDDSAVATAAFTFSTPQVATPTLSPDGGADDDAFSVTISTATAISTIYYTTDGSTPTTNSAEYSSAINVSETTTIKARGVRSGYVDSAVGEATFTVRAEAPVITPNGAISATAVSVSISSDTTGSDIYYTTDGTDPDETDAAYTGAFSVSESALVKAIAIKSGIDNSSISSAFFNVGDFIADQTWQNFTLPTQAGIFTFSCTILPDTSVVNAVAGLSDGAASDFPHLSCIVRFFNNGKVDVRNGAAYESDVDYAYTAQVSYRVVMTINIPGEIYSVAITPEGGETTQLATDYAFRTSVAELNNLGFISVDAGNVYIISDIAIGSPARTIRSKAANVGSIVGP